ncbi:site-specific integrase [Fimbriiglobus ruber]|uniref:Phage integrase n=1 Tax=Fimbriiglobus ruber TaxID=1908690 RepID=A0A225DFU1_9BACT|nr:site-specific integrase [Fimbriiglobus ruber]OWK37378.1 Phage integrase [Fimbriiglobus ruber]
MGIKPSLVQDRGDGIWLYTPSVHKTEHFDRDKVIVLGPQAQEVLRPWLDRDPESYCFVPAESVLWMRERRRKPGNRKAPKLPTGLNPRYTRHSYRLAVQRACEKAGVPVWSPNQLRHTRATQIRAAFGSIEAARAVLGHTDTRVTEIYAERDLGLAAKIMKEIG